MKLTYLLFTLLVSFTAHAYTVDDVKTVDCHYQYGFFRMERDTRTIHAEFAGITPINNLYFGEERAIEFKSDFPNSKFNALGGLSLGGGIYGITALLFTKPQTSQLSSEEKLTVLFYVSSRSQFKELMDCKITF